jgi:hypothetical protein
MAMHKRAVLVVLLGGLWLLLHALAAYAQTDEEKLKALTTRVEQLEKSGQRAGKFLDRWERFKLDFYLRERFEFRGNAAFDSSKDDSFSFVTQRFRLGVGVDIVPKRLEAYAQLQDVRTWGLENSTISNENNLDLHQGYLLFKDLGVPGFNLKAGRQKMMFANQRLVGFNEWNTIARTFDQVRATYSTPEFSVDAWAALTKESNITVDQNNLGLAANPVTPNQANREGILDNDRNFFGLYGIIKAIPDFTIEPYVMYDSNGQDAGVTDRPYDSEAKDSKRLVLGGRTAGKIKAGGGEIDLDVEGAVQAGSTMDPRIGRRLDIEPGRTYMVYGILGYTWKNVPFSPRIGFEYDRHSGDDNPNDGKFDTWNPLYPTAHLPMGFMDLMGARNNQVYRFNVTAWPSKTARVTIDYHMFWLLEDNDFWYRAGRQVFGRRAGQPGSTRAGAPATGPDFAGGEVLVKGNRVGDEVDIVYHDRFWERFTLEIGYSRFFPKEVASSNGGAAPSDWVFVQGLVTF